ncbi:MAG: T9SS type A sorting domain-containing protein [Bacteroidota bacterium]|jgi:hypothetical protein
MKKQIITILTIAIATATGFQSVGQNRMATPAIGAEERNPVPLQSSKPSPITNNPITTFCPMINTLNVLDRGSDLVVLGWDNNANFASITIRWTLTGGNTYRHVTFSGTPNPGRYVITGLNSTTTYDFEVSTTCPTTGAVSNWTRPITVTTFDEPAPRLAQIRNNTRITINPNPATTTTIVSYQVPAGTVSQLVVVNLAGREVFKTQIVSTEDKTQYTLDVTDYASGLYFVRISNRNGISTERLTKL